MEPGRQRRIDRQRARQMDKQTEKPITKKSLTSLNFSTYFTS